MPANRKRHRCCYCGFVSARLVSCGGVAPTKNYRSQFMCASGPACQRRTDVLEARAQKELSGAR